jgi:hypothetical protein
METNNGIVVNGGQITNASVGNNNSQTATIEYITINEHDLKKINDQIDQVLSLLKVHKQEPKTAEVISSVEDYKKKINESEIKRTTLIDLGKSILDNMKYVTMLSPIAHTIWQTIIQFFQ